ncbi:hypothetical protein HQQ81_22290 [Microbacteriaceae bacterium VKM Ac-2854]|nr:hypothetical protein [Microbacteriaceae bacterium VKM Ac-2854]
MAARTEINGGDAPHPTAEEVGVRALRHHQVRLTTEQRATLAGEYVAGGNIRQLALSWGISREAVRNALKQQRVDVRRVMLTDRQLSEAAELRLQGRSLNQLGALYGVDPKTMKARLKAQAEEPT